MPTSMTMRYVTHSSRHTINDGIASPGCPTPGMPYASFVIRSTTSEPTGGRARRWLLSLLDVAVFVRFAIVIIATHCIHDRHTACIRAYLYSFFIQLIYANANSVDHYSPFSLTHSATVVNKNSWQSLL